MGPSDGDRTVDGMEAVRRRCHLCIAVAASADGGDHVQLQQHIPREPEGAAGLIRLPLARPPVLLRLIAEVHQQRLGIITCSMAPGGISFLVLLTLSTASWAKGGLGCLLLTDRGTAQTFA